MKKKLVLKTTNLKGDHQQIQKPIPCLPEMVVIAHIAGQVRHGLLVIFLQLVKGGREGHASNK